LTSTGLAREAARPRRTGKTPAAFHGEQPVQNITSYVGQTSDPRQSTPIALPPSNPHEDFQLYLRVERAAPDFQTAGPAAQNEIDEFAETVTGAGNALAAKRSEMLKSGKYTAHGIADTLRTAAEWKDAVRALGRFHLQNESQLDAIDSAEQQVAAGRLVKIADGTWEGRQPVRDPKSLSVGEALRLWEIRTALRSDPSRADDLAIEAFDRGDQEVLEAVEGAPRSLPCCSQMALNVIRDRRLAVFAEEKAARLRVAELRQRLAEKAAAALGVALGNAPDFKKLMA
jgi:hypothetical protein